ncbi:MAG: metallophosphoesterase, partial [candidate division WOR-3 bacterium]
ARLRIKLAGPLGEYGRDANGMPVRVSVDPGNQIVRLKDGSTVLATAVAGASNDRVYRFTFPFASLTGYRNGDRSALVPVPSSDIVKVHLTFAPRFEDVEAGLREGGRLREAVTATAPGVEEEWHLTDADQMLAGRKYYVGTPAVEERITCIANFGLVKPDPELPDEILRAAQEADGIIHAGDFTGETALGLFRGLGPPLYAVRGNMDSPGVARALDDTLVFEIEGVRIGLTHGWGAPHGIEDRIKGLLPTGLDVIIFGHSHKPLLKEDTGLLLMNPGSTARVPFGGRESYGFLFVDGGKARGELRYL